MRTVPKVDVLPPKDVYSRALSTNLFSKVDAAGPDRDPEQIVPLVLARASAEYRSIEQGRSNEDTWDILVKVVSDGLVMVRQGTSLSNKQTKVGNRLTIMCSIESR